MGFKHLKAAERLSPDCSPSGIRSTRCLNQSRITIHHSKKRWSSNVWERRQASCRTCIWPYCTNRTIRGAFGKHSHYWDISSQNILGIILWEYWYSVWKLSRIQMVDHYRRLNYETAHTEAKPHKTESMRKWHQGWTSSVQMHRQ